MGERPQLAPRAARGDEITQRLSGNRLKAENVIDSKKFERAPSERPISAFSPAALSRLI